LALQKKQACVNGSDADAVGGKKRKRARTNWGKNGKNKYYQNRRRVRAGPTSVSTPLKKERPRQHSDDIQKGEETKKKKKLH